MKLKFKKTPIFFLSLLIIPVCFFGAFYYLFVENNGGMALAGAVYLFALTVNLVVLFVEQLLFRKGINMKKVWIVEVTLFLLVVLYLIISNY